MKTIKYMKRRDYLIEQLSDVKNLDEPTFTPGGYVPLDTAFMYPSGLPF